MFARHYSRLLNTAGIFRRIYRLREESSDILMDTILDILSRDRSNLEDIAASENDYYFICLIRKTMRYKCMNKAKKYKGSMECIDNITLPDREVESEEDIIPRIREIESRLRPDCFVKSDLLCGVPREKYGITSGMSTYISTKKVSVVHQVYIAVKRPGMPSLVANKTFSHYEDAIRYRVAKCNDIAQSLI